VRDFLDRLVTRKLAKRFDFRRDRGHVYHLCHAGIYDAIGQDDHRHRRRTSAALIARQLMLLDYVLSEPTGEWYATEDDKVAVFTTRFGVPKVYLPQRVYGPKRRPETHSSRYFDQQLPIRVAGDPAVVSVVFLVTDTSRRTFGPFLHDHVRLLSRVPDWQIVAVAPPHIPGFPACQDAFRRFVAEVDQPRSRDDIDRLRAYFSLRQRVDRDELERVTADDINHFRDDRRRFAAHEFEHLYRQWQVEGDSALGSRGAEGFLAALRRGRGQLVSHQLPIRYDRFGTRAGVV